MNSADRSNSSRDVIYPMSRQELAVPQIPWIRLRDSIPSSDSPVPPAAPGNDPGSTQSPSTISAKPRTPHSRLPFASPYRPTADPIRSIAHQTSLRLPTRPLPQSKPQPESVPEPTRSQQQAAALRSQVILDQLRTAVLATKSDSRSQHPTLEPPSPRPVEFAPPQTPPVASDDHVAAQTSLTPSPSSDERQDAGQNSKVAAPKFLKHAVRFGGSPASQAHLGHSENATANLQQDQESSVQTAQVAALKGVDQKGQVYCVGDITASESTPSALADFLREHYRGVEHLPIINVNSHNASVATTLATNQKPIPPAGVANPSAANTTVVDSVTPYWIQALIQIILGTLIIVALMNLHHWLRSQGGSPMVESSNVAPSNPYPVQQANSLEPETSNFR